MTVRPGHASGKVAQLIPRHGPGDRRPRPLDQAVTTLGRARGCDLCLDASDVSTIHCIVYRSGTVYLVRDCDSRAGTRINGDAIRGDQPLHDGDLLLVGPFSFELHMPASAGGATGSEPSAAETTQVRHYTQSRRRFAEHALRLRRLLRKRAADGAGREGEVQRELARLRERTTVYERRLKELNEADRELEAERDALRARVQQVEGEIARRFEEAEQQVRERWQQFQRRCQTEEAAFVGRMQQREMESMKQQVENGPAGSAQQEAMLRNQRAELARMLNELRQLQEELRRPVQDQLKALTDENEQLRSALADYEAKLAESAANPDAQRELTQTHARTTCCARCSRTASAS